MTYEKSRYSVGSRRLSHGALALGLAALVVLAGCREEEQGRIIGYEPGVYQGKADTPLSAETLDTLRSRASLQSTP